MLNMMSLWHYYYVYHLKHLMSWAQLILLYFFFFFFHKMFQYWLCHPYPTNPTTFLQTLNFLLPHVTHTTNLLYKPRTKILSFKFLSFKFTILFTNLRSDFCYCFLRCCPPLCFFLTFVFFTILYIWFL